MFALVLAVSACGDGHDHDECAGDPMIMSFSADTTTMPAGADIQVTVMVHNFTLSGHEEGTEHEHTEGACIAGHYHIYLDDLMTNPLAMPATMNATVNIPPGTAAGEHTLIARLHDLDHMIVQPQVMTELSITVQ